MISYKKAKDVATYALEHSDVAASELFDISAESVRRYKRFYVKFQESEKHDDSYPEKNKKSLYNCDIENDNILHKKIKEGVVSETKTEDKISQTVYSSKRITSEKEMAEKCNIDLNIWKAVKITSNEWNISDKYVSWQFKVIWGRITDVSPQAALLSYEKLLKDYAGSPEVAAPIIDHKDVMVEINIPDLHLGRSAWEEETGNEYNVEIAAEEWLKAHEYFYSLYEDIDIDTVVLLVGSDFFNVDSLQNTTTRGTPQNEDGSYMRSFNIGLEACVQAINLWRTLARVRVVIVPGNHDTQRAFYLGSNLKAWYRRDKDVDIDNSPTPRKYVVFGRNLIGFTHGKKDHKRLPTIFQKEMRPVLSQCDIVEWHIGHIHQERLIESHGNCTIRTVPALAYESDWEKAAGYSSMRQAFSFLWDKDKGLLEIKYYTPAQ